MSADSNVGSTRRKMVRKKRTTDKTAGRMIATGSFFKGLSKDWGGISVFPFKPLIMVHDLSVF